MSFHMLAYATTSTYRILTGPVPGWVGVLLFIAAGLLAIWQLRRDLAGMKSRRRVRRVLALLRLAIVAVICWLLCQPVLLIERHWTPPPEILVVVDSGSSMRVNEGAGDVSRQLDDLEAVAKPIARRNNAGSRIARACGRIGRAASTAVASLLQDQAAAATGLPLGPSVGRKLDALGMDLRAGADELISARATLPVDVGDKELKKSDAELLAASQLVGAAIDGIVPDGAVVGREAPKSPTLLDAYLVRLRKLASDADSLGKRAAEVQVQLDSTLLTARELDEVRAKPLTRLSLADLAADRLAAQVTSTPSTGSAQGGLAWTRQRSPALATALDDAFRQALASPLAAVVLLSDGSSPPPPAGAAGSALAQLHVPVGTVLIGADGEEPADAGLVAVDVPRVALAGDAVTVRCLVKNLVSTPAPRLTLSIGKQIVATHDLAVTKNGYDIVELPWTPAAAGRVQLVFRIESAHPDAYPGNENSAATVDVIGNKAHVLIVSDRLSGDFAAIAQLLGGMPAVDARTILAAPGLSKFHTGSKSDEFPATGEDFKGLSLLVLIGDVPESAGGEVIQALKQAIDAGLRVWVQAPAAGRPARPWTAALGIEIRPIDGRRSIEPVNDLWLSLYELGRETDESAARWRALPPIQGLSEIVTAGVALLTAGDRPILALVPRKAGAVIVSGISDFTLLRSGSGSATANRLLAEALALGLTPIGEPGAAGGAGMFPSQPVLGRNVFAFAGASGAAGLDAAAGASAPQGAAVFRVADPQTVSVQAGGQSIERVVRRLVSRQDFQLAAHDAPLEKIAKETGGRHGDLLSLMDVLPQNLAGTPRSSATRLPLWPGIWPLLVLLGLVSAEYLLRRRAGKVM